MSAVALYARRTEGFDERLAHAVAALKGAVREHPGRIVQATSLGAEDMVLSDLIARHRLGIAIATLETGMLHDETLALIPRIEAHCDIAVEVYRPVATSVVHFVRAHGPRAMYRSIELRKNCCAIRKLEPLARMLSGRSAWVTGLRREQSNQRGEVRFSELDERGRTKFSPLADWSWADVWHYLAAHDVPCNPLHDRFYPSIGCAPCTRAVAAGEDFRAGRWWWENESARECGLHASAHSTAARAAPAAPAAPPSRGEGVGGVVPAQADFDEGEVGDASAAGRSQDLTLPTGARA